MFTLLTLWHGLTQISPKMSYRFVSFLRHFKVLRALAVVCATYGIYRLVRAFISSDRFRQLVTSVLSRGTVAHRVRHCEEKTDPGAVQPLPEVIRGKFTDLPMVTIEPAKNHSHADSASSRSSANSFIDRFAAQLGRQAFYIQKSRADERNDRHGSRIFYWIKDLTATPNFEKPGPTDVRAMVDVDYYTDLPSLLLEYYGIFMLYTFQPSAVSRNTREYSYTFNSDNTVDYHISGGGRYQHEIWNLSYDSCIVYKTVCGVRVSAASYLIDRRHVTEDHQIVLFTPIANWSFFEGAPLTPYLFGQELARLRPVVGDFTRLLVRRLDKTYVSTGKVGSYACAMLPIEADDALAARARTSKYDLTLAQCQALIDKPGGDRASDTASAVALLEFHRSGIDSKPPVVCPIEESIHRYQFDMKTYDPEAKPLLVPFMNPIVDGCYAADLTEANEADAVKKRIVSVKTDVKYTPHMAKMVDEFAKLFLPVKNSLIPVDFEEVLKRQERPEQRRILETSAMTYPRDEIKSFIKKEASMELKPQRIISTINGNVKNHYSTYLYALSDYMKDMPWYAFGRKPCDIALRIVSVCSEAHSVVNTDLSKFDGRISLPLRELESVVLLRAFQPQYHEEISSLHRKQMFLPARLPLGTRYESGTARASGSPETSAFNSISNAFMAYTCLRRQGFEPSEAYRRLGIYGGDDGLTADVDPILYSKICASFGQKLTAEPLKRGQLGVKFLARMYSPNVWFGDVNSCCDIYRQLSKFHVTVALPMDILPKDKLLEKARAFSLTDRNTPFLGDFVSRVVDIVGEIKEDQRLTAIRKWQSDEPIEVQYPNVYGEWMEDVARLQLPGANRLVFKEWCEKATSLQELLKPPTLELRREMVVEENVVVDGELHKPRPKAPTRRSGKARAQPKDQKKTGRGRKH